VRQPGDALVLQTLLRPEPAVPETLPADDLLEVMRRERTELVLVVDEYGGTAGIVTWGDMAAALLGAMETEAIPRRPRVERVGRVLVLDGLTRLTELEEMAGIRVVPDPRHQVETLGGLLMAQLGRDARLGDEVRLGPWWLRVQELDGHRVARVAVSDPQAKSSVGELDRRRRRIG
jgi:CBS domain containing-hemolysin-like protein